MKQLNKILENHSYPGRGMILGKTPDCQYGVVSYFIMGRSQHSRNRIFVKEGEGIKTQAWNSSLLKDPSLIIYAPVRVQGNKTIIGNGNHVDYIYSRMERGMNFEQSICGCQFEPDSPHYTPRISGVVQMDHERFQYILSIIKSAYGNPDSCQSFTFSYKNPLAGQGHFLHTYQDNKNPLPSFEGEPRLVETENKIDVFTMGIWEALNRENKISLFVRYIHLETGEYEDRIMNKQDGGKLIYV